MQQLPLDLAGKLLDTIAQITTRPPLIQRSLFAMSMDTDGKNLPPDHYHTQIHRFGDQFLKEMGADANTREILKIASTTPYV